MNKNRIRLTESQLHRVIRESVKRILNESEFPNNRQIINMTGIYDDDEMNAAAQAEEDEDLEFKIIKSVSSELCDGGSPSKVSFSLKDFIRLMKEFGFEYLKNDDEKEEIIFANRKGEKLIVWPAMYYHNIDSMRIKNLMIF